MNFITNKYKYEFPYNLSILESSLNSLHSWFCHNGLGLNSQKSDSIAATDYANSFINSSHNIKKTTVQGMQNSKLLL